MAKVTVEQIIETLKQANLNEKEREIFFKNLDINLDKITQIIEFEIVDYDWLNGQ